MINLLLLGGIAGCILSAIKPYKQMNMASVPLLIIGALFLLGTIDLEIIKAGLFGNDFLEPWKILVIFFTVAYAANSTDVSGLFDVMAFRLVQYTKGETLKLFTGFYFFAGFLTLMTSNDIVILTLTPIIFYLGKYAKLNIIPFLFAEFFAANTFSMLFLIGNPTNIIVTEVFNISFLSYAQVMFLPTLIAVSLTYCLLRWYFREDLKISHRVEKMHLDSVENKIDATFSAMLMLLMLMTLLFSDLIGLEIWIITSAFAGIFLLDDLFLSQYYAPKYKALATKQRVYRKLYGITHDSSDFNLTRKRMPWAIAPFIIALFILVQGLLDNGVLTPLMDLATTQSQTIATGIFGTGLTGALLANIINNQPMTILVSSVLASSTGISDQILLANAYALVIASNLGANLTLLGALAGLMWKNILDTKGLKINYWSFLKVGLVVTPPVLLITLLILYLEFSI